ncbi:OB-fold domain-containing protein [Novosphingobium sp. MMS21-SN21R]|uniref:Zn-ribbon domain-containing OB-fold protein n=1 Tax=Novosphingobium sp. MMS21-SN21R TaxID=2969298 RepID=UPI0028842CE8|nr:OB-fold domain-containing protein [Novosphingobium sp. MMS21-SN21R]MDT0509893.1 OB-fold domain-containing protein [Novosphingobium sp. MMS21-SN21R]
MASNSGLMAKAGNKSVRVGADGTAWIEGYRCEDCGAVMAVPTMACRACASRVPPAPYRSAQTGKLYTWSIVHRSYPGVAVPFVSAIVDLDGGLSFKGTLKGVAPEALKAGLPVRLVFDDAGGTSDADGSPYVGFHFVAGDAQ